MQPASKRNYCKISKNTATQDNNATGLQTSVLIQAIVNRLAQYCQMIGINKKDTEIYHMEFKLALKGTR